MATSQKKQGKSFVALVEDALGEPLPNASRDHLTKGQWPEYGPSPVQVEALCDFLQSRAGDLESSFGGQVAASAAQAICYCVVHVQLRSQGE